MTAPLQPLLHDELVVLRAPTQAWSDPDGSMRDSAIHGIYFSDVRLVCGLKVRFGDRDAEHLSTSGAGADSVRIDSLLRHLDSISADPGVRLTIERTVDVQGMRDILTLHNRHAQAISTPITIELDLDSSTIDAVKMGLDPAGFGLVEIEQGVDVSRALWGAENISAQISTSGLRIEPTTSGVTLGGTLQVPPRGHLSVSWRIDAVDAIAAVAGDERPAPWSVPVVVADDLRLTRWVDRAIGDLDALRMTTARHPEHTFLAAGAPWFFTLFGRDSLWAARFMLPLGTRLAGDTLRILAKFQGVTDTPATAEEPGKIMHELRRKSLVLDDTTTLPPLYYGTIDATPLWVCLLHDAWRWGLPDTEVNALIPHLEAALGWMRDYGDADGDGLLEYVDKSGHGLANQGWKDSGDSVQWRDGTLAEGPIALCEVQAYAYEAAIHGADLLEHFGRPGAEEWRQWAARLRTAFHQRFWITDPAVCGDLGPYPAIALDANKRRVDTVTSNLGHLLGTGLLDNDQASLVAARLGSPELDSGFGLRTMSTDSDGYWPLSYHNGSVWTHDTAIAALGLAREGFADTALQLVRGLLRAAESFDYRMPELHSGDPASDIHHPIPYPAACRPQAWSASAAIAALSTTLGLMPDADGDAVLSAPLPGFGAISVQGLRIGDRRVDV